MEFHVAKIGRTFSFDETALPANSAAHALRIGLAEMLKDCHAGVTEKEFPDAERRSVETARRIEAKWAALTAGTVRAGTPGTRGPRTSDPVAREALAMARAVLTAKHKNLSAFTPASIAAWCNEYLDRNPDVRVEAARRVAALGEAGTDDELDGLLMGK